MIYCLIMMVSLQRLFYHLEFLKLHAVFIPLSSSFVIEIMVDLELHASSDSTILLLCCVLVISDKDDNT